MFVLRRLLLFVRSLICSVLISTDVQRFFFFLWFSAEDFFTHFANDKPRPDPVSSDDFTWGCVKWADIINYDGGTINNNNWNVMPLTMTILMVLPPTMTMMTVMPRIITMMPVVPLIMKVTKMKGSSLVSSSKRNPKKTAANQGRVKVLTGL